MLFTTHWQKKVRTAGLRPLQPPKKVQALVGLSYDAGCVSGPREVIEDVQAQVFTGGHHLHSCSSDEEGRGCVASFPEVHNHLLSLPHIDAEIVCSAPVHKFFHLLAVVGDQFNRNRVICRLHYMVALVPCTAIISVNISFQYEYLFYQSNMK